MHEGSFHGVGGDAGNSVQWIPQTLLQQQQQQGYSAGGTYGRSQMPQQSYLPQQSVGQRSTIIYGMPGQPSQGGLHQDPRTLPMQVHALQQPIEPTMYAHPDMVTDVFGSRLSAPRIGVTAGHSGQTAGPSAQPQGMVLAMQHPGINEMLYIQQPVNMLQSVVPMNMMANSQQEHMNMARLPAQVRNTMPVTQHLPGSQVLMQASGSGPLQSSFMPNTMHQSNQHKLQPLLQARNQLAQSSASSQARQHLQQLQQHQVQPQHQQLHHQQYQLHTQQHQQQVDAGKKKVQRGMEENVKRTIYVSYIDVMVSEEQLANFFGSCGPVVDCRICADPNSAMRFAFLEFSDIRSAQQALSMSGTVLGGWPLRVQPSKTAIVPVSKNLMPRSQDELVRCSRTVYVASIDKRVEKNNLSAFFEGLCGPVAKLRLLGDATHNTRIAFVEFVSAEGALAALNCSGALLGSLPVRVSPSKTPIRSDTRGHRGGVSKQRDKDKERDKAREKDLEGQGASSSTAALPLADTSAAAAGDNLGLTEHNTAAASGSNQPSTEGAAAGGPEPDGLDLEPGASPTLQVPDSLDLETDASLAPPSLLGLLPLVDASGAASATAALPGMGSGGGAAVGVTAQDALDASLGRLASVSDGGAGQSATPLLMGLGLATTTVVPNVESVGDVFAGMHLGGAGASSVHAGSIDEAMQ